MDIVYTIKQSASNEELFYSLRSLENLPHDNLYIIGGCPYNINLTRVHYIRTDTLDTKYKTTTHNLEVAANLKELSDDFIWMNDDFYILQKIENPAVELNLHRGTIQSVIDAYIQRCGRASHYILGAKSTMEYIQKLGHTAPLSYELHIPMVYNKENVKEMLALPGIKDLPILHKRSVYGNMYIKNATQTTDVKILSYMQVDYQQLENQKFLSSADITWRKVAPYLQRRFKSRCKYEV